MAPCAKGHVITKLSRHEELPDLILCDHDWHYISSLYIIMCLKRQMRTSWCVFNVWNNNNKKQKQKPLTGSAKGSVSIFWCNIYRPQPRSTYLLIFIFILASYPVLWKKQAFGSWTSYKVWNYDIEEETGVE